MNEYKKRNRIKLTETKMSLLYYLEPMLREHYHVYFDDIMNILKKQEENIIIHEKLLNWSLILTAFVLILMNLYLFEQMDKDKKKMMDMIRKMSKKIDSCDLSVGIVNDKWEANGIKMNHILETQHQIQSDILTLNHNCQILDTNVCHLYNEKDNERYKNEDETIESNIESSVENDIPEMKYKSIDEKIDNVIELLYQIRDVKNHRLNEIENHIENHIGIFKNGIDGIHMIIDDLCIRSEECLRKTNQT